MTNHNACRCRSVRHSLAIRQDTLAGSARTAVRSGTTTCWRTLEFSEPIVSQAMDGVQRYISSVNERPTDVVERADAALAALAAQH